MFWGFGTNGSPMPIARKSAARPSRSIFTTGGRDLAPLYYSRTPRRLQPGEAMRRSAMSFATARTILGGNDPGIAVRINQLLGLTALASGAVGLAPHAAAIRAGWSWIDQKNELVGQ